MKTILVLEDEKDILQTLAELLQTEGYEVHTARNGKEALNFLEKTSMPDYSSRYENAGHEWFGFHQGILSTL